MRKLVMRVVSVILLQSAYVQAAVINVTLPNPLKSNETGFLVLIENSENGKLIQSLSLPLANCNQ
jgi:hypothetical protein